MTKIGDSAPPSLMPLASQAGPSEPVLPADAPTFAQQMTSVGQQRVVQAQAGFVALLSEIDDQGKRLVKHPIRAEIARYRTLVGKFLKEASARMATAEKRTDRRNRTFVLIKEIDRKLAELTEMLLNGQAEQIDVLAKLNEIQGMLVDLQI